MKASGILGVVTKSDEENAEDENSETYSDQSELTYVSESEFRMRIQSFSIKMIKKNLDTIIYMIYKAWIEDNVEYIILICLFWFL